MVKVIFKCLLCSRCCRNLLKEFEGQLHGLSLFSDEKNLFPNKLVSEQTGIGWGPLGPKYIVNYQLNVNVCPHLSKDNRCGVYNKRPLACQAFPLVAMGTKGGVLTRPNNCTYVEEIERKMGSLDNLLPITPKNFRARKEWQAIARMNRQLKKFYEDHPKDGRVLWGFDLKNKEWQILMAV